MKWSEYLRVSRDDLLRRGLEVRNSDVVDNALTMGGASAAWEECRETHAYSKALRDASRLLSEASAAPLDDPETLQLFDDLDYRPPRAITMRDEGGEMVHKAIEHVTLEDGPRYIEVLDGNIQAAVRKRHEFGAFWRAVTPFFAPTSKLSDALRNRSGTRRKAA